MTIHYQKKKNGVKQIFSVLLLIVAATFLCNNLWSAVSPVDFPTVANAGSRLTYQIGYSYLYSWNIDMTSRAKTQAYQGTATTTGLTTQTNNAYLRATVRITPLSYSDTTGYKLAMVVESATFYRTDQYGTMLTTTNSALLTELQRPVYFYQLPDGRITSFYAYASEDVSALNIKRGIISSFHTILYNSGVECYAPAPEQDVCGSAATTSYASVSDSSYLTITRTKTEASYAALPGTEGVSPVADISLNEKAVSKFNLSSKVLDSVTIDSKYASTEQDKLIYPAEGSGTWSDAFGKSTLTLTGTYTNPPSYTFSAYIQQSLTATDFEIEDEELIPIIPIERDPVDDPSGLLPETNNKRMLTLATIKEELENGTLDASYVPSVIQALSRSKSPEAQEIMAKQIALNEKYDMQLRGQALVALGLTSKPTDITINTLETLSNNMAHPLYQQAILMLGAVTKNYSKINPSYAANIVKNIETKLLNTFNETNIDLYLESLGNAASPSSVEVVAQYLTHSSPTIRFDAVTVMGRINTPEAINYLQDVVRFENESEIRQVALSIIKKCNMLEDDKYAPQITLNNNFWNAEYKIGKGDVYGKIFFDARINWDGGSNNFMISGNAEAIAYAWSKSISLVKGYAVSNVETVDGVLKRKFTAKAYIKGIVVASIEKYLTCGQTYSGTLWSQSLTFLNMSYSFYPYGIKVTVGVEVAGSASITYNYGYNACNAPITTKAYVTVTPTGSIKATGSASASIYVAKAGVSLETKILATSIPTTLTAIAQTITPYLSLNLQCILSFQPISGKLYFWAKVRRLLGGWRTVLSVTIWSFSASAHNYTLLNLNWIL